MNKKEKALLEEEYQDCLELEKEGFLTEYGAGWGDLCIRLLKKKSEPFEETV